MPNECRIPLVILLDADGVLFDFVTPALDALHACGGPRISHDELNRYAIESLLDTVEQRMRWWALVTAPGFCAALQPYAGALESVRELRAMGHVLCVTSPMDTDTWAGERARSLRQHFEFSRDQIISTSGKRWVPGDYLADDNDGHCDTWRRAHPRGRAVLIARSYNAGETTLRSFVEMVREENRHATP